MESDARAEAAEGFGEIGEVVAFGLGVADAEVMGTDSERTQAAGESGFGKRLVAALDVVPGAIGKHEEGGDQIS